MSEETAATTATETTTTEASAAETVLNTETTTEAKFLVDAQGNFAEGFKDMLPEDMRGHSYLDKYKTLPDMIKAGMSHQSALTKKASEYFESEEPVVVAERNKLMGIPEKAEDYKIDVTLPEGFELGKEGMTAFRAKAHEIGLPQKYVNELAQFETDLWLKYKTNQDVAAVQQKETSEKSLREEWKGDTFEHNTRQVQNLMKDFGLSEEDLQTPIGNSTALIKALFEKVVPLYGEDKLIEGTMSQSSSSAGDRIKAINIEAHPLGPNTPEYKALMDEKAKLMSRMK